MIELDHVVYFSKQSPEVHVQKHEGTAIGGRHKNWGTICFRIDNWLALDNCKKLSHNYIVCYDKHILRNGGFRND